MKQIDSFSNKTTDQKIQELADREEIRELIARYALRVANGRGLSDLFTEDGVFTVHYLDRPDLNVRGRKAIAAFFDGPRALHTALPMIHNVALEISGDEATGICSNELRITENGKSIIASGYYRDRFRRENGHWKFASREASWFHWVPLNRGWAEAPDKTPQRGN